MADKHQKLKEAIERALGDSMVPGDELFTFDQASFYTGVSRGTIRRLAVCGELPIYTSGIRKTPHFVRRSDLDARMKAAATAQTATASKLGEEAVAVHKERERSMT